VKGLDDFLRFTGMKNGKLDMLVVAGLAVCALAACSRRTLTAGAVKAAHDAAAPDGANDESGPLDVANADAREPDIDTSPDGQSLSGPCGEATCLIDLFQTCVPAGDCAAQLGSTVAYGVCYANGVTVSYYRSGGYETTTTVERNGVLCYSIKDSAPPNTGAVSYVVTDDNGNEVATGVSADRSATVTVTCTGGTPITVDGSCLWSVSDYSTCDLQSCPTSGTGGYDGGDAGGTAGTTGGTGGSGGGAGGSTSAGGATGGTGGSSGGMGGSTSTDTAATLRCTLPRGPDAEPGMTCTTYCQRRAATRVDLGHGRHPRLRREAGHALRTTATVALAGAGRALYRAKTPLHSCTLHLRLRS